MIFNETVGEDRTGLFPRTLTDNTSGQAALAAHAYTPAGQNDYTTARAGIGNSIPEDFGGLHLYNSALTATAESTSSPATAAPELTRLATGPESPRPGAQTAPESTSAPATAAPELTRLATGAPELPRPVAQTAPESFGALPTVAPELIGAPAATAPESTSAPATGTTDATSASATAAALTPEQAAVAQATVQISTPVVVVGADGTLTEEQNNGSGFIVNGNNGQQYVVTAGHVPEATGQDGFAGDNGQSTYAEGPSTVTFADGTQTTGTVIANNTALAPNNFVQTGINPDIAVMSIPYNSVTGPYPALQFAPSNTQPSQGDTLTAVGYPVDGGSQPTLNSSTYLGMVAPYINSSSSTLETTSASVPGMSGGPVIDSNGNVVGVTVGGTNSYSLDTPASYASNLIDSQNPLSPNYFYNLFNATPQPIATLDDHGNGSDQTFTGFTLSNGTHLDAPPAATAPANSTPEVAPPTAPAVEAPPAVAPPASDAPPAAAPAIDTPPAVTPPAIDTPPEAALPVIDTPPFAYTAPPADTGGDMYGGGEDFGGGDFFGGGGGNRMTMDVDDA